MMARTNSKFLIAAALAIPPLLVFGLRGLPSTDRPPRSDFDDSRPANICSYRQCPNPAAGIYEVRVTTGTDSQFNRTLILVDSQPHRLCERHALTAARGRWLMHGWKFYLSVAAGLLLCGFLSLGILGVGLVVSALRMGKTPPAIKP